MQSTTDHGLTYERIIELEEAAGKRYHQNYNNSVYTDATRGQSVARANALIDEAYALCGSPRHSVTFTDWSVKEIEFLKLFCFTPPEPDPFADTGVGEPLPLDPMEAELMEMEQSVYEARVSHHHANW